MSLHRYTLPVEDTHWKPNGQSDVAFTWDYDARSDDLLKLYAPATVLLVLAGYFGLITTFSYEPGILVVPMVSIALMPLSIAASSIVCTPGASTGLPNWFVPMPITETAMPDRPSCLYSTRHSFYRATPSPAHHAVACSEAATCYRNARVKDGEAPRGRRGAPGGA